MRIILLSPFFSIIFVVFGFTAKSEQELNESILFDSCIDYVNYCKNSDLSDLPTNDIRLENNRAEDEIVSDNDMSDLSFFMGDTLTGGLNSVDTLAKKDSLSILEKIARDPRTLDSTARLSNFKYDRDDPPNLFFRPKKQSSFFTQPTSSRVRTAVLDTTGTYVIIKEEVGGLRVKPELRIPLEDYIALRQEGLNKDLWEDIGYKYELKEGKKDLSQILSDITNIDIPLPSVSFLSIFGPPKINLKINGAVDIKGAWKTETTEGLTASRLGNTRNEPEFKQTVQISVNGTIGDKLSISADWNTERTFEYENMLKIKYTGYEDEMIQSIEAGNVSLQTSSLVGGSEALFGLKAQLKFGPLSLIALASQKKGEIQEMSVTSGSKTNQVELHAYDYSPNHFFVDTVYADTSAELNMFNKYYGNATPQTINFYSINEIQVWKSYSGTDRTDARTANAFITLPPRPTGGYDYATFRDSLMKAEPGIKEIKQYYKLLVPGSDYIYHAETGFISLRTGVNANESIAVAYNIQGNGNSAATYTYFGDPVTDKENTDPKKLLVLKLIKPANLQPGFTTAWKLQLKNIYSIKGMNINEAGFKFNILFKTEGQDPLNEINGVKLLHAFGLDNGDGKGSLVPDDEFDFKTGKTIDEKSGEIIFPTLQPFGGNFPANIEDAENKKYQSIYDTTLTAAKQDITKDKFLFNVEYSAAVSKSYNIGFNVVENSVKVLLNGRELSVGSDYSVDYNSGQVTILNDAALVAGADLRITFEQNDLFSLASKTLVGLRGLYEFSKRTKLGFSFLNLNQQTLSDKVRIGEEPLNNSIWGVDFETSFDMPFLTKALDKVFSTSAMSSFKLTGEYAYINPDPNTKKSTISSDQGQSIAYIDDFEGSKRIIPVGVSYTGWKDLSVPDGMLGISDSTKKRQLDYKGKSFWYNILPSDVNVKDIWPNKQVSRNDQQVTVLDYMFKPNKRGTYNTNQNFTSSTKNWGGMMKLLSSSANNLIDENIEYIEFWMQIKEAPANAKLYLDLGLISEDIIPNNVQDKEDKNDNSLVDEGEDTGIDGLLDFAEPGYSAENPDPNGDNFYFASTQSDNPDDYQYINGTQGNAQLSDIGRVPDNEALDGAGNYNNINSYFRYEIPLDTSKANPFLAGGGEGRSWYLFKIPLKDFTKEIGTPSLSLVEIVRLWVNDVESDVHLRIGEFNLVGNQWQKVLAKKVTTDDEVLTLSTINIEDNPEYTSPPGVFRERDKSNTDEQVLANEQSLLLRLDNLGNGDNREIVKYLTRKLDVFYYKEMKMFVHGDLNDGPGSISYYVDENNYLGELYFRFGSDSTNFYEYRQPIKADWNEIKIIFSELTSIKQGRDSVNVLTKKPVVGKPGHYYGVKGNPTLTQISYFSIGILNPKDKADRNYDASGDLWVNELRVLGADDTPGWAYSGASILKLADILTVNLNVSQTDPNFHKLSDRFGSRIDRRAWGVAADLDVMKILPISLPGSTLRLNYSRTESVSNPVYLPGTDIKVDEAVTQEESKLLDETNDPEYAKTEANRIKTESQTISVSDTWSLSNIKIKLPTEVWYIRDTFNALSFGFNFNKTFSRNPQTMVSKAWVWSANAKHSVNLSSDYFFYPVKFPLIGDVLELFPDYRNVKIYFTPQSFSSSFSANRRYTFTQSRATTTAPSISRDFNSSRDLSFAWKMSEGGFLNLTLNYGINITSTYAHLLTNEFGIDRREKDIWRDIFSSGSIFGKDLSYTQSFDLRSSPKLPTLWNLNKYFTITAGYNVGYNWANNISQATLGKSAGFTNKISTGVTLRWKSLWEPLFKSETNNDNTRQNTPTTQTRGRGKTRNIDEEIPKNNIGEIPVSDSLAVATDSLNVKPKESSINKALVFLKSFVKTLFIDYEQFTFQFNQTNSQAGNGIAGDGTGFNNFWGIKQRTNQGPSRIFMLGLSGDIGPRALGGNLTDNYSQSNTIDLKTSRPLWEGATIDIDWKVAWKVNKTTTLGYDEETGQLSVTNVNSTGTIERSFFSMPPSLFLSVFKSGIKRVNELYNPNSLNPNQDLSDAFLQGFESFSLVGQAPFLSKVLKYLPRPNWRLNWSGLEKISIFKSMTKRVSLSHAYTSSYSEGWKLNQEGTSEIQSQRINYGFQPLLGLTMTFNSLWNGDLTGAVKYSTKTAYDLGMTTKNITETFSRDINITASYKKSGFEIPLFGISLKNDIEVSFSYTTGKNSSIKYDMNAFTEEGTPLDGTTRTTMEPRLKYVMSSKVTLSLFYTRTTVEPEGASKVSGTTTNIAGLDIHIAIQ
ncbi:MAG: cell surface protein SprA [bacterium]